MLYFQEGKTLKPRRHIRLSVGIKSELQYLDRKAII